MGVWHAGLVLRGRRGGMHEGEGERGGGGGGGGGWGGGGKGGEGGGFWRNF